MGRFFAFLLYFSHVVSSGPIDRYRRFSTDWQTEAIPARGSWENLDAAVHRIFTGIFL